MFVAKHVILIISIGTSELSAVNVEPLNTETQPTYSYTQAVKGNFLGKVYNRSGN